MPESSDVSTPKNASFILDFTQRNGLSSFSNDGGDCQDS